MTAEHKNIVLDIQSSAAESVNELYGMNLPADKINVATTRKGMDGDFTIVVFPFTKAAGKKPEEVGEELGAKIVAEHQHVEGYNVIKGFLNLSIADSYWLDVLQHIGEDGTYGHQERNGETVVVEFSSPNTNKPLHLGHIRNILLGWSVSKILDADGYDVKKVQIVNDRGIAICPVSYTHLTLPTKA